MVRRTRPRARRRPGGERAGRPPPARPDPLRPRPGPVVREESGRMDDRARTAGSELPVLGGVAHEEVRDDERHRGAHHDRDEARACPRHPEEERGEEEDDGAEPDQEPPQPDGHAGHESAERCSRERRQHPGEGGSLLVRISHQLPAADANLLAVTRRTPSSRFDVVSATPSASFGPCALSQRHLDALATKVGEICGPAPPRRIDLDPMPGVPVGGPRSAARADCTGRFRRAPGS